MLASQRLVHHIPHKLGHACDLHAATGEYPAIIGKLDGPLPSAAPASSGSYAYPGAAAAAVPTVNLMTPLFNADNDLFTYLDHYLKENQVQAYICLTGASECILLRGCSSAHQQHMAIPEPGVLPRAPTCALYVCESGMLDHHRSSQHKPLPSIPWSIIYDISVHVSSTVCLLRR